MRQHSTIRLEMVGSGYLVFFFLRAHVFVSSRSRLTRSRELGALLSNGSRNILSGFLFNAWSFSNEILIPRLSPCVPLHYSTTNTTVSAHDYETLIWGRGLISCFVTTLEYPVAHCREFSVGSMAEMCFVGDFSYLSQKSECSFLKGLFLNHRRHLYATFNRLNAVGDVPLALQMNTGAQQVGWKGGKMKSKG